MPPNAPAAPHANPFSQKSHPDPVPPRHEYDSNGRLTKTVEIFLDAAPGAAESLSKVTTIAYQNQAPQETTIVKVLGQEVERRYKVTIPTDPLHQTREIVCAQPGAAYTDPTNLVTLRKLVESGPFTGEIEFIGFPDGTREEYSYSSNGATRTTIQSRGTPASGTRTTTTVDIAGNLLEELVEDLPTDLLLSLKTVVGHDEFGRPVHVNYDDGAEETMAYGCCGLETYRNREGIVTTYAYDALNRLESENRAGLTVRYYTPMMRRDACSRAGGSEVTTARSFRKPTPMILPATSPHAGMRSTTLPLSVKLSTMTGGLFERPLTRKEEPGLKHFTATAASTLSAALRHIRASIFTAWIPYMALMNT